MGPTIVSIGWIVKAGCVVSFEGDSCYIKNKSRKTIGKIPKSTNGLYKVEHQVMAAATEEHVSIPTLHCRLGHISSDTIHSLIHHDIIDGMKVIDDSFSSCNSCDYTKTTQKPIKAECTAALATAFGEEVHLDMWGPLPLNSMGG
jgi:GAG-pre-integrase domain